MPGRSGHGFEIAYDHILKGGSGSCLHDKRCAIELGVLREGQEALQARIRWVPHAKMVADGLTKRHGNLAELFQAQARYISRMRLCLRKSQREAGQKVARPHSSRWVSEATGGEVG